MEYQWPYENEYGQTEIVESDVLVLGGGLAGCLITGNQPVPIHVRK